MQDFKQRRGRGRKGALFGRGKSGRARPGADPARGGLKSLSKPVRRKDRPPVPPRPRPERARGPARPLAEFPPVAALLRLAALARLRPGRSARWAYGAALVWVAMAVAVGGWRLWHTPLTDVALQGHATLAPAQVLRAAGLVPGMALGAVDPFETARRLAAHPRVRAADVRRVFPARLSIDLHERRPTLRIALADGREAAVDPEGMVLHVGAPAPAHGELPRVLGLDVAPRPGTPLRDARLTTAQRALAALAASPLPVAGAEIDLSDPFLLRLRPAGRPTLLVPPDRIPAALAAYTRLRGLLPDELAAARSVGFQALGAGGAGRVVLR